ncbi:uncharacterized protein Z518_05135 [Rhinocladiella mackenziei CBS 650.93]|uniref:Uncharacterized protein n=1 Tax=Rhinocladiella mackenziei CBS 650.93 TaxID=1442369 RepID=A0A0D2H1D6_9EURO|nr:uncharacterized protein Z518_05135 [Rhinocladiella mackenziei CBS 650.93]KIX04268.1 hypothetical protein Z518_05135 [Rhinocladiella mackenziei CBS 650.93]
MEITAPHLLVKLPRATRPDAAILFGSVHAVRKGAKRRRKEICAAVDGDSLSIYEVQNGKILTSYPVPPTSHFLGQPCSICSKVDGRTHRKIFCAIKRNDLRIECFEGYDGDSRQATSSKSPELRDQNSPIVLLDVRLSNERDQILVVQQKGALTVFSADLKDTISETALSSPDEQAIHVLAIQHLTKSDAQKTILKRRSDLLSEASSDTSYLAVAYGKAGSKERAKKVYYGIWSTSGVAQQTVPSAKPFLPIVEHELVLDGAEMNSAIWNHKMCSFGTLASRLYMRYGAAFLSYDLSGLLPVLTSVLRNGLHGSYEIMAITPAFAIYSFQDSLQLYDLKYQSIQAHIDTRRMNPKRKRMRMASELQSGTVEFVTYFPQSARILGRRRHQLLAIDISSTGGSKRVLERGGKLLHSIGRGISTQDVATGLVGKHQELTIGTFSLSAGSYVEWQTVRKRLDHLAQAGDVMAFEEAFDDDIRKCSISSSTGPSKAILDLPRTRSTIPDFKIHYLLSKIFQIDPNPHATNVGSVGTTKSLKVQFPTFKLIIWLAQLGLLSGRNLQGAIPALAPAAGNTLAIDAVAEALYAADPSRDLLIECLESGYSPYVEEKAAIVQMLIKQALVFSSEAAGSTAEGMVDEVEAGDTSKPTDVQVQKLSASTPDPTRLPMRLQRALVVALDRFGASASSRISTCLRNSFSQTEVLALIQFLRQQLFQGGHTRSFQSLTDPEPMEIESVPTVKLDAVVSIMSSCIDAIGPLGFFGALDNEDFIGNIIPDMVTEITHTKQSLEDVAELQGILRETLRYQESTQKYQNARVRVPSLLQRTGMEQLPGKLMTLYPEASEGQEGLQIGDGLPLSSRAGNVVNPMKIRKGGGQISKRSDRERAELENMGKGRYSFEKLVL